MSALKAAWWVIVLAIAVRVFWAICGTELSQLKPLTRVNTVTQYQVVKQVELEELKAGESVKYGDLDLCVSSIQTFNIKAVSIHDEPPIVIYLRKDGQCN